MDKKLGLMVFLIVASTVLVAIPTVSATILEVGPGKPYATIQAAVIAAGVGDTIRVYSGTFGPFTVSLKNGLTIVAVGAVVVQGSQSVITNYGARDAVVFVESSVSITLKGLDIEGLGLGSVNPKNYAVIYEESSGTIESCKVSPNKIGDMSSTGIGIWDGSSVTIDSTTIVNYGRIGILIYNGCTVGVYDSTIVGQVYIDQNKVCYGIEVEGEYNNDDPATACDVTIKGNEIYNNDNTYSPEPSWSSGGILVNGWLEYYPEADSTVIIEDNFIHNNYDGIEVVKSTSSYAHGNCIEDNRVYGVLSAAAYDQTTAIFDAENNWWGDPSGPTHNSNPGGTGDEASDNVDFDPWLTYCPLPICAPVGGEWILTDKAELLAPSVSLASATMMITAAFVYIRRKKKQA